jgi:hypothetical protein
MSYCAVPNIESDSRILIDACLARVRVDAKLDEEPVLPPLEVLVGPRTRIDVFAQTEHVPSAEAIVKSVWSVKRATLPDVVVPRLDSERVDSTRLSKQPMKLRWPVFLCGFLAGIFGGVALMKSPVGRTHAMRTSVAFVKHEASHAYAAAVVAKAHVFPKAP